MSAFTVLEAAEAALVASRVLLGGQTFKSSVAVMEEESFNFLEFDALVSASYVGNAEVTKHPVEGTKDVTDHIRPLPRQLTLRGIVSNYPIMALASFRATPSVPGTDPSSRAEAAFLFLEGVKDQGKLVHVATSLFDIENMAITSLGCTRDKETSTIVDMTIVLEEIAIAVTEKASVETPTGPSKAQLGKQAKKAANAPVATSASSILVKLLSLIP